MKEKFIKSTIILTIGGFLTKILSMLIRILMTRIIGIDGIGLYMLVMPTFNLLITLSSLSMPLAISKIVSEDNRNNKKLVLGIIPISIFINILIILIVIFLSPFIADKLLHNRLLFYPIISCSITLPFISLSGILRGYFFGKQKMVPSVISNLFEQLVRIFLILFVVPKLMIYSVEYVICGLILSNICSEFVSIIVLILYLPKKIVIRKSDIVPDFKNVKDIFLISVPTTAGRIISSISLFLEPIIITYAFSKLGYNDKFIIMEYGIITGYVLPIVTLPSFLSGAISNALLPVISNKYQVKDYKFIKAKIKQAVIFSLFIGIECTIVILLFPKFLLNFMFKTTTGVNYLVFSSIIFIISYISGPITSTLQAINKSDIVMKASLINMVFKNISLFVLCFLDVGMYALIISYFISYLFTIFYEVKKIREVIK